MVLVASGANVLLLGELTNQPRPCQSRGGAGGARRLPRRGDAGHSPGGCGAGAAAAALHPDAGRHRDWQHVSLTELVSMA